MPGNFLGETGVFAVVCSAYNDDNPGGVSATVEVHVVDTAVSVASPLTAFFWSSSNRWYAMEGCSNLVEGAWTNVPGAGPRRGVHGSDLMTDTNIPPYGPFYRLGVSLQE